MVAPFSKASMTLSANEYTSGWSAAWANVLSALVELIDCVKGIDIYVQLMYFVGVVRTSCYPASYYIMDLLSEGQVQ